MPRRRLCDRSLPCFCFSTSLTSNIGAAILGVAVLLAALPSFAQDQPPSSDNSSSSAQVPEPAPSSTITLPAGTHLALVLTHPIQSRHVHRGDDIYAQITSPLHSGNEVVIPPGTFIDGIVDKLERRGGRGELRLQSMSITFPNGYVAPVNGPVVLESDEGYAIKDPGQGRAIGAIALPAAGAGIGALIGHSITPSSSTISSSLPPGCTGPPPGCVSSSMTVPGSAGRNTVIGAGIGGAIGMVASLTLLFGAHHFYLDVGAPVEMTLQHPVTLQRDEVTGAVRQSEQGPVSVQPIAARPLPPPPPPTPVDHGTCYTPGTPGTSPTVIPGAPGPDGIPGPPTIIPGIPPTPGTPYPCP